MTDAKVCFARLVDSGLTLSTAPRQLEQRCVDTIRVLSADMVEKANSGHPGLPSAAFDFRLRTVLRLFAGMPLGMAPIAHVLWGKIMKYNPADPKWVRRPSFNHTACGF